MPTLFEKIRSQARARADEMGGEKTTWEKLAILAAVAVLATLMYLPTQAWVGHSYSVGDVAGRDVKSPVEASRGEVSVKRGETVVRDGAVVTAADIERLDLIEEALGDRSSMVPAAGVLLFSLAFLSVVYYFSSRNIRGFATRPKDLLLMAVVLVCLLALTRFAGFYIAVVTDIFPFVPPGVYKYTVPVAVGAMLVRLILNAETALVFAVVAAVMSGLLIGVGMGAGAGWMDGPGYTAYALIGGVAAAVGVRQCTHRSIVLRAGLKLGAVNAVTLLALSAMGAAMPGSGLAEPFYAALAGVSNGVITAVLAIGVTPLLESGFRYTTNMKLLELARMDHPVLKDLAMRAPGTYHHSIVIGTLVEAAAESINANPLLARVAAYYHDIGKTKMPGYFIENAARENRHDKLTPSMSALIISSHAREGAEMARKHHLGAEIADVIRQHHGTSLITFFYQKAKDQAGEGEKVEEKNFRYPGPKPQTKEAGLVMLADSIEAASKTLKDPTADRIQYLTQKIVNKIFADGQLDECELTLKDLHAITRSFNRVLSGIYHQRIDYPEPADILREERKVEDTDNRREGDGYAPQGPAAGEGGARGGEGEGPEDGRERLKRLGIAK